MKHLTLHRAIVATAAAIWLALPGAAQAQTTFSFTIENNSGNNWTEGVLALLPEGSSPEALFEPGLTPTSGDLYATYNYAHANCDTVVTDGDANGLVSVFSGLVLGDNAVIVPALNNGDSTTVNITADPGEVLSFIARVSGSTDDVVVGHEPGDTSDTSITLFGNSGLPVPGVGFEISGYDANSADPDDGNGSSCGSVCPPPSSGCYMAVGTGTVGVGAGGSSGASGTFDFDVALWTRTETGFTTDTIAIGDVYDGNDGDEILVLMQGGVYYSNTGSVGTGKTIVLDMDGTLIKTFTPGAGRDIMGPVTVADIDGSAPDEFLIGEALSREESGSLIAIDANTTGVTDPASLWFQSPRGYPGYWNLGTSVADVTGDSDLEVLSPSYEGVLQILDVSRNAASVVDQIDLYAVYGERHYGHAAVADVDGDGTNEIAVAGNTLGQVIVFNSDGDPSDGDMTEVFLSDVNSADGVAFGSGPAIANIDDDPELEIIVALTNGSGGSTGVVRAYDIVNGPGSGCEYQWSITGVQGFRWVSPVVGDLDGDGDNEIVMQGNSGKLSVLSTDGVTAGASCVDGTIDAQFFVGGSWSWFTPALADLTGDAGVEVVVAGYEVLEVLGLSGGELRVEYRSVQEDATFYASPVISPGINGSNGPAARITVNGWVNGVIYQFGTQNDDNTPEAWSTFMGNNQRTGTATVPLVDRPFQQDSGSQGLVSLEAENYDANVAQGSHAWEAESSISGASGSYLIANPDDGTSISSGYASSSPRLDFDVEFNKTGTHYVWVRGYRQNNRSDSCHAGLDGAEISTADNVTGFANRTWDWSSETNNGQRIRFDVATTGVHTVNIWMREDGFRIDKIVLTTDSSYTPTGTGPAESPR